MLNFSQLQATLVTMTATILTLSLGPNNSFHRYRDIDNLNHPSICAFCLPALNFRSNLSPLGKNLQLLCHLSLERSSSQIIDASHKPPTSTRGNGGDGDLRIVFASGGTGGHIYPAVAIADEIRILRPDAQILFIGTESSMESEAVPSAGYDFASIPAVQLARPILSFRNITLPRHFIDSTFKSWNILREFEPHVVVGTGGYVSFPVCLAAAMRRVKLVIQEQNCVPGIANWILSNLAERVFVAYNSSVDTFPSEKKKIIVCGNPVRLSLKKYTSKAVARAHFFPRLARSVDPDVKVVLVLGGSLGAHSINISLLNLYYQMLLDNKNLYIIWETGVEAFDEMDNLVRNNPQLVLSPFLHSMDLACAAADLVVSRAGAMTCSELLAMGKPAILIPSPNADEGHQSKNAALMADLAGSRIINEDELDSTTLGREIMDILENEIVMAVMSERAFRAARPNAGVEIAKHILHTVHPPATGHL